MFVQINKKFSTPTKPNEPRISFRYVPILEVYYSITVIHRVLLDHKLKRCDVLHPGSNCSS